MKILGYKVWQYPFIFIALIVYAIQWKFRFKALIRLRYKLGLLAPDEKVTFKHLLSLGHWLVAEFLIDIWRQ